MKRLSLLLLLVTLCFPEAAYAARGLANPEVGDIIEGEGGIWHPGAHVLVGVVDYHHDDPYGGWISYAWKLQSESANEYRDYGGDWVPDCGPWTNHFIVGVHFPVNSLPPKGVQIQVRFRLYSGSGYSTVIKNYTIGLDPPDDPDTPME